MVDSVSGVSPTVPKILSMEKEDLVRKMEKKGILGIIIWISIIWIPFYIWLMRPAILFEAPQGLIFVDYLTTIITASLLLGLFSEFFKNYHSPRSRTVEAYQRFVRQTRRDLLRRQHRGEPPLGAVVHRNITIVEKQKEITPHCDLVLHKELLARNYMFCIECGRVLRDD